MFTKINIWRHNTKHRLEGNLEKAPKKGRKLEKEKTIPVKQKDKLKKPKKTKKKIIKNENLNSENIENENIENVHIVFLDDIIKKVKTRLDNNEIKPTITEAIKATELKLKIEKNSPYEDVLLNFVENISDK